MTIVTIMSQKDLCKRRWGREGGSRGILIFGGLRDDSIAVLPLDRFFALSYCNNSTACNIDRCLKCSISWGEGMPPLTASVRYPDRIPPPKLRNLRPILQNGIDKLLIRSPAGYAYGIESLNPTELCDEKLRT